MILALAKLVVSAFVLLIGFRAVSDDDYARVVIAQEWALTPKLDPTGTSWLPAPFWITGATMRVFGRTLLVAQVQAVVFGVLATWLVYVAGLWISKDRRAALLGALIACAISWSAMLGVCTVPELLTGALTLVALASVAEDAPPRRVAAGGLALLVACLSRYEPWFVAIPFIVYACVGATRARGVGARALHVLGAALALAGPIAWIAWNRHAHGAPLHFLASVASYNESVAPASTLRRLLTYAYAALRAEPELIAFTIAAVVMVRAPRRRSSLHPLSRPALACAFLFVALTGANVRGGAPTHHPERSLLLLFLVLSLAAGIALAELTRAEETFDRRRALGALLAIAALSWPLRRWVLRSEVYAHREREVDIGERSAAWLPHGTRVHLDVLDYGYFAVQAASGRPEDFIPNVGASLVALGLPTVTADGLRDARASGLPYAIVRLSDLPEAGVVFQNATWALVDLEASREPR